MPLERRFSGKAQEAMNSVRRTAYFTITDGPASDGEGINRVVFSFWQYILLGIFVWISLVIQPSLFN